MQQIATGQTTWLHRLPRLFFDYLKYFGKGSTAVSNCARLRKIPGNFMDPNRTMPSMTISTENCVSISRRLAEKIPSCAPVCSSAKTDAKCQGRPVTTFAVCSRSRDLRNLLFFISRVARILALRILSLTPQSCTFSVFEVKPHRVTTTTSGFHPSFADCAHHATE